MKKEMKITEKAAETMKDAFVCDNCLGRQFAQLLSGLTNKERGRIIRHYIAFSIDAGKKMDVGVSNFYGIKFRHAKMKQIKPRKCKVCKNFFLDEIDNAARKVAEKLRKIEFDNFLVGTVISNELLREQERLWQRVGIEWCEPIKSEINRELGKRVEKIVRKKYKEKNPHAVAVIDLNTNRVRLQIRSLYVIGGYKKFARGISQTKWVCPNCRGKGCVECKGLGKLYKVSVQEIIEKPLIRAAKAKQTKFHGAGREDADARCLDWRPFIIELARPLNRKIDLKKIRSQINKSKKVQVSRLKFANKEEIRKIKSGRSDKTYLAVVTFKKTIDKKKLKLVKKLAGQTISQKTPTRVAHRRADKYRKRKIKSIRIKQIENRKMELRIRTEAGTYIKELIAGDESRTQPSITELLNNKVKKINLDVVKIHTK